MNLTNADVIALRRVFGLTDVDRISKGRLVTANTSHMHFIDYMMVQLYKHEPTHELFKEFTVEQHKLMRKKISEEKRREYMMGPQSVGSKLKHDPKCTVEQCAEDCAIAAEGEKQLPEFSPSDGEVDRMQHLCGSCRSDYPSCDAKEGDVEFGDALGGDNVVRCKKYVMK